MTPTREEILDVAFNASSCCGCGCCCGGVTAHRAAVDLIRKMVEPTWAESVGVWANCAVCDHLLDQVDGRWVFAHGEFAIAVCVDCQVEAAKQQ